MNIASEENELQVYHQCGDYAKNSLITESLQPKSKYRELLIMFVKDLRNPENSWFTHFTSLVEYNSIMNIMFTTPAMVKRGHEYELGVTLSKEGYYLIGLFNSISEKYSDNVRFILSGNTASAFISSLIFTH